MKILLHSINYAPEVISVGKYNGEMCEWLAAQGHEVRVVTAPPYYPAWRAMEGYSSYKYRRERRVGVDVWRCPVWIPARPTGIKRLLHLASFAASSFPVMLRQCYWRPDVVMMTEPSLLCAPQTWLIARLSKAKMWLHVLDFELDTALSLKMLSKSSSSVRRFLYGTEHFLMRGADRVSTISERMRWRLAEKGIPKDRTRLFPNWADIDFVRPLPRDNEVRQEFGAEPEDVLVMYAGNMGEKQGLDLVLETADRLRTRAEIKFAMVGAGAARGRLEQAARQRNLKNVRFFPIQPLERLPLMLAAGDVHLILQRREAADLVMPSKLTNILAAGRPSVATADPGTTLYEILNEHDCGLATTPDSVTELVASIVQLVQDAEMRERLGRNARRYAESYLDKDRLLSEFERELEHLIK